MIIFLTIAVVILLVTALILYFDLRLARRGFRNQAEEMRVEIEELRDDAYKSQFFTAAYSAISQLPDPRERMLWLQRVRDFGTQVDRELEPHYLEDLRVESELECLEEAQRELLLLDIPDVLQVIADYRGLDPGFAEHMERVVSRVPSGSEQEPEFGTRFRRLATLSLGRRGDHLKVDPQELEWEHQAAFIEAEGQADAQMSHYKGLGRCHGYWAHKKEHLLKHHGISWSSPKDLNPGVLFD